MPDEEQVAPAEETEPEEETETEDEEGAPVGPATIVEDEPAEQFPTHEATV